MKKNAILLAASGCFLVSGAISQVVFDDGRPPSKRRSEELEKLNFMVGTWDTDAVSRFKPDGKEFKAKMIAVVQWSPNGQFLISDEWELMPGFETPKGPVPQGWMNKLVITTWDPLKKEYALINVLSNGAYSMTMSPDSKGGVVSSDANDGKHITHMRTTFEHISDTETKFSSECAIDQGSKWVCSEGTSKKRAP